MNSIANKLNLAGLPGWPWHTWVYVPLHVESFNDLRDLKQLPVATRTNENFKVGDVELYTYMVRHLTDRARVTLIPSVHFDFDMQDVIYTIQMAQR